MPGGGQGPIPAEAGQRDMLVGVLCCTGDDQRSRHVLQSSPIEAAILGMWPEWDSGAVCLSHRLRLDWWYNGKSDITSRSTPMKYAGGVLCLHSRLHKVMATMIRSRAARQTQSSVVVCKLAAGVAQDAWQG